MIYYVEDDDSIRELVLYALRQAGFGTRGFADGDALEQACADTRPALVLLDIMLPGRDGYALLKALKARPETADIPVIMLTAKGAEYDKVTGLDGGADDYIVKPFGMMELVSRVKAVLRRGERGSTSPDGAQAHNQLVRGALRMDTDMHEVFVDDEPVRLTYKEYELLRLFMENSNMAFEREKLLSTVWGYDYFGGTRTVDVHIQTLRQKLGKCGNMIETVRGVGYRLGGG